MFATVCLAFFRSVASSVYHSDPCTFSCPFLISGWTNVV
jgi:hypothetical protein